MKAQKSFLIAIFFLLSIHLQAQVIDPASLPEVEDYTVVRTNPDADTVILVLHGGPTDFLYEGSFWFMENVPTFSVVEVSKQEMLSNVLSNSDLTLEEGIAVNDTTAALIEKTVQYYNELDKTVVLLGHSWGAIILGEYMDDYGINAVHRIIPMEGRINMQPEFVDYLLDGYLPTFEADGYTMSLTTPQYSYEQGLLTLAAAAFYNRWVDSLSNLDLSNMMYTYAENDMQTGALLPEETDFLDNTGARLLFIPSGNHGDSNDSVNQKIVLDFIREDIFVETSTPIAKQENLNIFPSLAQDRIQIETDQSGFLSIYNLMGVPVYQMENIEFPISIDVSGWVIGQYVVVLQNDEITHTGKFQILR